MKLQRTVIFAVLSVGVLGLWEGWEVRAQQGGQPPFANAVDQRNEMIRELKAIRELLKTQNELLSSMTEKNRDAAGKPKK